MVFDFVLTVLIVVHTPRVYPIEAKEKKPRGPEVREGGGGVQMCEDQTQTCYNSDQNLEYQLRILGNSHPFQPLELAHKKWLLNMKTETYNSIK